MKGASLVASRHDEHEEPHLDSHGFSAAAHGAGRLRIVLGLTAAYMLAEIAGAFATNSLALLADAAHMLMDVLGLAMALFAIQFAQRPATQRNTYGFYRAEILAALVNSLVLLGIAGFVLYEAWHRLQEPPTIRSLPLLAIAAGGFGVNLFCAWLLHRTAEDSLNLHGAFLEVVSDLLGSVGVMAAALIVLFTGWTPADPIVSVLIGLFIIPRTWHLLTSALDVLLEASPRHLRVNEIEQAMAAVPGVVSVHDLHVWTITSGFVAMSGHVIARDRRGGEVLHDLRVALRDRFKIEHATIQVERVDHADDGACCIMDPRCLVLTHGPVPWPPSR